VVGGGVGGLRLGSPLGLLSAEYEKLWKKYRQALFESPGSEKHGWDEGNGTK